MNPFEPKHKLTPVRPLNDVQFGLLVLGLIGTLFLLLFAVSKSPVIQHFLNSISL